MGKISLNVKNIEKINIFYEKSYAYFSQNPSFLFFLSFILNYFEWRIESFNKKKQIAVMKYAMIKVPSPLYSWWFHKLSGNRSAGHKEKKRLIEGMYIYTYSDYENLFDFIMSHESLGAALLNVIHEKNDNINILS